MKDRRKLIKEMAVSFVFFKTKFKNKKANFPNDGNKVRVFRFLYKKNCMICFDDKDFKI